MFGTHTVGVPLSLCS